MIEEKCDMYYHNLYRLIESSPFEDRLSEKAKDALVDLLAEINTSLCNVNIDDLIINGISIVDEKEYEEYKDNYYLLCEDGDDFYILQ